jgi:exopolyphosphatase/guanosine-5'-triphosphate,3'-diphosphate pyrophosphatase
MSEIFVSDEKENEDAGGVRRMAVTELADRSGVDPDHAAHVAALACSIFDQTEELHELGAGERELLEYAALLHEIGLQVSYQRHHKHTYYLIRHASLDGFTAEQVAVLANVARYHRKARPKKSHENFAELSNDQQVVVEKLSAILRLAEGLDRGRRGAVCRVELGLGQKKVRIDLHTQTDLVVEIDSAEKASKLFTRVFGRKVEFDIKTGPPGRRRETTRQRSGLTEARF